MSAPPRAAAWDTTADALASADDALAAALVRFDALLAVALDAGPPAPVWGASAADVVDVLATPPGHTRWSAALGPCQPLVDVAAVGVLPELARRFGLNAFETDALLVVCAPDLDQRYEYALGYLQGDLARFRPTVATVGHLAASRPLPQRRALRMLGPGSTLRRTGLVRAAGPADGARSVPLVADDAVLSVLTGLPVPAAGGQVTWLDPAPWALHRGLPAGVPDAGSGMPLPRGLRMALQGPDWAECRAVAHALATRAGCPLAVVRLAELPDPAAVRSAALAAELRDGLLLVEVADGPAAGIAAVLSELDTGFVLTCGPGGPGPEWTALAVRPVSVARPDAAARALLWLDALGRAGTVTAPADVAAVATDVELGTGQIATAAARFGSGPDHDPASAAGQRALLGCAAAELAADLPAGVERRTVRASWADLVLDPPVERRLREVCDYVRHRATVLGAWGLGRGTARGHGVNVLLCGSSGTGKTTACEVLAAELGRPLLVLDAASVVSKYLGDTEKRLAEAFDVAERGGAVLVVDEADALFGKRTTVADAHDRYANREVSYLLQRVESYRGILALTTNLQANVDPAFARRLQFVIELPFPDERARERIWRAVLGSVEDRLAPDVDVAALAVGYPLAGGHLRAIAVGAAVLAAAEDGVLRMRHLDAAARRELEKLGRSVPERPQ